MTLRKNFRRIILILLVVSIGIISIVFIFRSFKVKSQNENKTNHSREPGNSSYKETEGNKKQKTDLEADNSSGDNFYYPLLQPNLKEPEYQGELLPISSAKTKYNAKFIDKNLLPPGSAVLTSSGDLDKTGIKAIIHLTTRSIDPKNEEFQPRIYFARSIQQAIVLAERNGYKSIAFPLVDNDSLDLFFPPEIYGPNKTERRKKLVLIIMKAVFSQARSCKKLKKITFVDYGDKVFSNAWLEIGKKNPGNLRDVKVISGFANLEKTTPRIQGITDYSLHKCEVIVNTTFNVEGKFVGSRGLSGFICQQTGSGKNQIQKEIKEHISEFNQRLKK